MSRTLKDVPLHHKIVPKGKKKRNYYPIEWGCKYAEPGWHKHETTTIRHRNYFTRFISKIKTSMDLELLDPFNIWNKPHVYYW